MVTHSPPTSQIRVQFIYSSFNIDFNTAGHITIGSPVCSCKIHVADRYLTRVKGKHKITISNNDNKIHFLDQIIEIFIEIKKFLDYMDNSQVLKLLISSENDFFTTLKKKILLVPTLNQTVVIQVHTHVSLGVGPWDPNLYQ